MLIFSRVGKDALLRTAVLPAVTVGVKNAAGNLFSGVPVVVGGRAQAQRFQHGGAGGDGHAIGGSALPLHLRRATLTCIIECVRPSRPAGAGARDWLRRFGHQGPHTHVTLCFWAVVCCRASPLLPIPFHYDTP